MTTEVPGPPPRPEPTSWQYAPQQPPPSPPPWQYGPAQQPPPDPPRRRKRWPFIVAGVVVALGAGAGIFYGVNGGSFEIGGTTVTVTITDPNDTTCSVNPHTPVTIEDQNHAVLGSGEYGSGGNDSTDGCTYTVKIPNVATNASQYIYHDDVYQGSVAFSHDDLANAGWNMPIQIYQQGSSG